MAEKKQRKPWTPEARARHAAGVIQYQKTREMLKLVNELFDALTPFAEQHDLDIERTVAVYVRSVISLKGIALGNPKFIDGDFQESFIKLVKMRR